MTPKERLRVGRVAVAGLQFVCTRALEGGVTSALTLDTHGKTLSYAVLEMTV